MRSKKFSVGVTAVALISLIIILGEPSSAVAQQFQILYNFTFNSAPLAGVIFDGAGNMYGTTSNGTSTCGTVYEVSPQAGGGWMQTILHSFSNNSTDGCQPYAGLALDSAGNLYGTTRLGGSQNEGTAFELTPQGGGVWAEKVLHSFGSKSGDGTFPYSNPILDSAGNVYGTTQQGGAYRSGTVFELTHSASGWAEKVLHSFNPNQGDGYNPYAGLVFDSAGNLYGTTYACNCSYNNLGTVFELKHAASGGWSEKVLHSFVENGVDGTYPFAGLSIDTAGNLYGTTAKGGTGTANCGDGCGTVFKLTHLTGVIWKETILHNFAEDATDGGFPVGSLSFDAHGNLYGTTTFGGTFNDGTVFELTLNAGAWNETILHSFDQGDGDGPSGAVVLDALGNLYGTAVGGSANDGGNVFQITP
jgi:uncharacterized repeat protein (TIGR03803 family)